MMRPKARLPPAPPVPAWAPATAPATPPPWREDSAGDAEDGPDLVRQASERLEAYHGPERTMAVQELTQEHGLSDEVQLALRLLAPDHFDELLAGGEELRQKLSEAEDRNQLMRSLVSMLDPEVDDLVSGLLELEGSDSREAARETGKQDTRDLVAEAQRRLAANKSAVGTAAIKRFTSDHRLGDEVQLALRMLDSSGLEELLAGEADIQQKLSEVSDRNELMLSLVSMLDPSVVELVKSLQKLEEGQEEGDSADGAHVDDDADDAHVDEDAGSSALVEEAERRLAANSTATSAAAIERFSAIHGLGEEVQLAMRMLDAGHLEELLAGESDLEQRFSQTADRDALMMSLIAMLDSEVQRLVAGLQEVDQQSQKQPKSGAGAGPSEDLVAEAQERLQRNTSPLSTAAIQKLMHDHALNDEVHLALRLLAPSQLRELMAGGKDLQQKLQSVADRNQLMLSLVKLLDADVGRLVQGLMHLDRQQSKPPQRPASAPTLRPRPPSRPPPPPLMTPGSKAPPPRGPRGPVGPVAPTRPKAGAGPSPADWSESGQQVPSRSRARVMEGGDDWSAAKNSSGHHSNSNSNSNSWNDWSDWSTSTSASTSHAKRRKTQESWEGAWESWESRGADGDWGGGGGNGWASGSGSGSGKGGWGGSSSGKGKGGNAGRSGPGPQGPSRGPSTAPVPPRPPPARPPARPPAPPEPGAGAGAAEAAAGAGAGGKKKAKCMICRGDHRAADCPKMK